MTQKRDDVRGTIRIIQIDKMLHGGNHVRKQYLIDTFGVKKRTIERDFERLVDEFDAPLKYERSTNTYCYTNPAFSISNVILSEGELFTVSTILPLMEQYENTPLKQSFRNIMSKMLDMLPDSITVDSAFLNNDVSFVKDPAPAVDEKVFNAVFSSIRSRTILHFDYKSTKRQSYIPKQFAPYHVLCRKGCWYIIGLDYQTARNGEYMMSRIKNIEITDTHFDIPIDFDVKQYTDSNWGIWMTDSPAEQYELLFDSSAATYVSERQWDKNQELTHNEDGSVILSFSSNQAKMIQTWVMSFGSSVTVLNPSSLINEIRKETEKMMKKYQ